MKQFIVDRHTTPNTPTLEQVPTEKIPIYENRAAVTADLANLSVGQIVATKDTGDELSQPVDVVEEGNLHAVSSNAVYQATKELDYWVSTNGIVDCEKIGKVVTLRINWDNRFSSTVASPKDAGTIPERFIPHNTDVRFLYLSNDTDDCYGQGKVKTDGTVMLYKAGGGNFANAQYYGIVTYVTSN